MTLIILKKKRTHLKVMFPEAVNFDCFFLVWFGGEDVF